MMGRGSTRRTDLDAAELAVTTPETGLAVGFPLADGQAPFLWW